MTTPHTGLPDDICTALHIAVNLAGVEGLNDIRTTLQNKAPCRVLRADTIYAPAGPMPHGPTGQFVQAIAIWETGSGRYAALGIAQVPEDIANDHFPGCVIFPGHCMMETLALGIGIIGIHRDLDPYATFESAPKAKMVLASSEGAEWRLPVRGNTVFFLIPEYKGRNTLHFGSGVMFTEEGVAARFKKLRGCEVPH